MKRMYEQAIDVPVEVWPAGVDTYTWCPQPEVDKELDVLVYDKVRWNRDRVVSELLQPIHSELTRRGLRHQTIRYGHYQEREFHQLLSRCRAMIFLVEHETQGFAYLQALACGVPILAWEGSGTWMDPEFYPDRVRFDGARAVPYWDERCGLTFSGAREFNVALDNFLDGLSRAAFAPRDFVLKSLSLEHCAHAYAEHIRAVSAAPQ